MYRLKRNVALLLSVILMIGVLPCGYAQEDVSTALKSFLEKKKTATLQPTSVPQENKTAEAESQPDTTQDKLSQDNPDLSVDSLTDQGSFEPDIMTAAAGTKVYADSKLTSLLGIIHNTGVVYAVSLVGNAVRIALVSGSEVIEGYVIPSSLCQMSKKSKAAFQTTAVRGKKVYGQNLMSIAFDKASSLQTSGAISTATPKLTAAPTIKATPAPTSKATASPTSKVTPTPTSKLSAVTNSKVTSLLKGYPVIVEQPVFLDGISGKYSGFFVKAEKANSYQWQYSRNQGTSWENLTNGTIWIGCKESTLFFIPSDKYEGYLFRCKLTNKIGTVYTDAVLMNLSNASVSLPEISVQPKNVSVTERETVTFQITALAADRYQWQFSADGSAWKVISGSGWSGTSTATLSFSAERSYHGYSFRCAVSNDAGTVYSNFAILSVSAVATSIPSPTPTISKPVFSLQPQPQVVSAGSKVTMTASAGNVSFYQWQYSINNSNWINLTEGDAWSGIQSEQLTFTAVEALDGYYFRLVASNARGSICSNSVRLSVSARPVLLITGQPKDVNAADGDKISIAIKAENASSYQWYYRTASSSWNRLSDVNIWSGTRTSTLSFTASNTINGYKFRCVVSGLNTSVTSAEATFTLITGVPVFDRDVNTEVAGMVGSYVVLTANVSGATSYQWQVNPERGIWASIKDNTYYENSTTPSLSVKLISSCMDYTYRLKATNVYGTSYSPVYSLKELIAQPTKVKALATGRSSIDVTWTISTDSRAKRYQVFYNTADISSSQSVTVTGNTAQLTGLTPATTYHIWVQALGSSVSSVVDDNVHASATTLAPPTKPGVPTSISADASSTSMSVSWKKPTNSEVDGYNVYYRVYSSSAYQKMTVSGENTLSAVLTGLSRDTNYQIWVTAYNEAGEGNSSSSIVVKTLTSAPAPAQPTNVQASSAGSTSVKVSWTRSSSADVAGYCVYYGTSTNVSAASKLSGTYSATATGATVTGLKAGTAYYFWVSAYNQDGAESALNTSVRASAAPVAVSSANKINAETFSRMGDKYIGTSYSVYDCQAFVERMLKDAGLDKNLAGSNAWYRQMSWRGTPEECKATFGCIPTGAFLFIVKYDGGEPSTYRDNLGNANHIGVVTHRNGGAIHSSYSRGGVYTSVFNDATIPNGGWNMVGLWTEMDYGEAVNAKLASLTGK